MTQSQCMRCQTIAPVEAYAEGRLWLCAACPLQATPCPEYQHVYRGSTVAGAWVCITCGARLGSQAIRTEPVPADTKAGGEVYI